MGQGIRHCLSCGAPAAEHDDYCGGCGFALRPVWAKALAFIPAVTAGFLIAAGGWMAASFINFGEPSSASASTGLLNSIKNLFLWAYHLVFSLVVPHMGFVFAFIGGSVAAVAPCGRHPLRGLIAGTATGALLIVFLVLAGALGPRPFSAEKALIQCALATVGGLGGWWLLLQLGKIGLVDWIVTHLPRNFYIKASIAVPIISAGLLFALGTLIAVLILVAIVAILFVILSAIFGFGGKKRTGYSKTRENLFGGKVTEQYDDSGKKIGEIEEKDPFFGEKHKEYSDADGKVVATSKEKDPLFGEKHVEYRDAEGEVVATSRVKDPFFGEKHIEHRDAEGNVIGKTAVAESLLGETYIEHQDADGTVIGESHVAEGFLGAKRVDHFSTKKD